VQNREPLDDVRQLANVSRPARRERDHGFCSTRAGGAHAMQRREAAHEAGMSPPAQRWNRDGMTLS
jgi:hypothetical protein